MKKTSLLLQALLFFAVVAFISCKKELSIPVSKAEELTFPGAATPYISSKAKLSFNDGSQKVKAIIDFRIHRDSLIWFSMRSSTGVEGLRGLITKDSIFAMNRLDREYFEFGIEELKNRFNFDFNFYLIQGLITAELPKTYQSGFDMSKENNYFSLKYNQQNLQTEVQISRLFGKISKISAEEKTIKSSFDANYDNFLPDEGSHGFFPMRMKSVLNYVKQEGRKLKIILELDYQKVNIAENSLSFPYKVPEKFVKAEDY